MPKRERRTEEQVRYLLQRGLEVYRRRIRQRAVSVLKEFLRVERLPRALTFREISDLVEAVLKGRRHVPWMYEWTLKYRGRWLAIKWAWYIREKEYWREKFLRLARDVENYRRMYGYVVKYPKRLAARMSAWADSRPLSEAELCTAKVVFGDLAEVLHRMRRLTIYDDFMGWAAEIRRAWPNRRYRVVLFLSQKSRIADRTSDAGGLYTTDVGYGNERYWVYSYRVYGKDLPALIRQFTDDLEAVVIWSIDPPPTAKGCV
jgi:hypothetical protein